MIYEWREQESLEILKKWVIQEAEYETVAAESIHDLKAQDNKYHRKEKSYVVGWKTGRKPVRQCIVCSKEHPIWCCEKLKSMSIHKMSIVAKQNQ